MLRELVTGTSGNTWTRDHKRSQNGRAAWLALHNHYSGGGAACKNITKAEAVIDNIHYKNESIFSFEDFSNRLLHAYKDLENTKSAKSDYNQVKLLLEKSEVDIHKAHVCEHYPLC